MDLGLYRICVFLTLCVTIQTCGGIVIKPEQVHLAAGVTADQMIITWTTFNDTGDSTVLYGPNATLGLKAVGSATKWSDGLVRYMHKVMLNGLTPATYYSYQVGSTSHGFSASFWFKTFPAGEDWSPRIAIFGDLGVKNAKSLPRLNNDTKAGMYDAMIHVGDFAYNMNDDQSRVGDTFMNMIEPVAAQVPYMVCPGNHEKANNFSNYKARFNMPGDENKQMFFSFNIGPVHFVSVSTEQWTNPGCGTTIIQENAWLEADLAEANQPENRQKRPWIIMFGHRPMYCSARNGGDCNGPTCMVRVGIPSKKIPGWEHLMNVYGVDMGIWAHEHSYERTWPVYDMKVYNGSSAAPYTNPGAPVHIVTGAAGCDEGETRFMDTVGNWSAFRSMDYGYTRMKVINSTHLFVEQVSDDKDGAIIDKFTLIKDKHTSYGLNTPKMWTHFHNYNKEYKNKYIKKMNIKKMNIKK